MNIGQVLELLRAEFPGVTIPKIRFWEAEGLVCPERTAAGYRKFSQGDVDRLRYVARMQRDHFLPLKVIREHLDAIDRGLEPPAVDPVVPTVPKVALAPDGVPSAESFRHRSDVRLSRRELCKIAEISDEFLGELEGNGLVQPRAGSHPYDPDALLVATAARELSTYGLEPRHLRSFKVAADREVGLVQQAVAPLRGGRDAAAEGRAEDVRNEMAALMLKLHATLVKVGLQRG